MKFVLKLIRRSEPGLEPRLEARLAKLARIAAAPKARQPGVFGVKNRARLQAA